jgi:hypothetical protein
LSDFAQIFYNHIHACQVLLYGKKITPIFS